MRSCRIALSTALGAAALAVLGVSAVATDRPAQAGPAPFVSSGMSTGVTVTQGPATTPQSFVAVPGITGPAPLPTEEQGLPG